MCDSLTVDESLYRVARDNSPELSAPLMNEAKRLMDGARSVFVQRPKSLLEDLREKDKVMLRHVSGVSH